MRFGLIIYGDLQRQSGGYLYDRLLVEHLQTKGHSVEVIALPWRNYFLHFLDNFSSLFRRRLASLRIDCLIQDELNHPSLFWLNRLIRKKRSIPFVTIVHHLRCLEERPAWQNVLYRTIERLYLSEVDGWVFNSKATRDSVFNLIAPLPQERYVIAYPAGNRWQNLPAEIEIINRSLEPGPLRLLFVGNIIPRKGLHLLLEALSCLPPRAFRLDIVGDVTVEPRYVIRLQRLASRFELERDVRFWGSVDHQALESLYQQAQVFVMPSFHEGFGIAYVEAMGFGLPVLASAQGGAVELISHGVEGFLIQAGDIPALAHALEDLHTNRKKLAEMAIAARRRYLQHPAWGQSMLLISDWLEKLIASYSAGRLERMDKIDQIAVR